MNVKGKSVKQLLSLDEKDFLKLDRADLARVLTRINSAANKRLVSLQKKNISTPATRAASKSGGKFSVSGKNLNQLRSEFSRVKTFMSSETSTRKGYKSFVKKSVSKLEQMGVKVSEENFERFASLFDELKSLDASVSGRSMRYSVMRELSTMVENSDLSDDEIIERIENRVQQIYEEQQEDISEFFEMQ